MLLQNGRRPESFYFARLFSRDDRQVININFLYGQPALELLLMLLRCSAAEADTSQRDGESVVERRAGGRRYE